MSPERRVGATPGAAYDRRACPGSRQPNEERDKYHRVIADLGRDYAWRSFDFEDSIAKEMWGVWIDGPDPIHFGRAGHRQFAQLLFDAGVIPRNP